MSNDNTFRPRKVVPNGNDQAQQPAQPIQHHEEEVNMEQVHDMQRAAGQEIPFVAGESQVKVGGNIPPEFRQYMQNDDVQTKRGPSQRPAPVNVSSRNTNTHSSDIVKEFVTELKGMTENFDKIELPSLGKFYNGQDGPTDGVLHIRPMTGNEEKILATPRFVKKGQAINMIFKNCLMEKFDPDNLLTIDRTYLLIYLRGISYTQDYEVEIKCQECGNKFQTTINLDTLYLDFCPDDFNEESLVDILPATGFRFKYRLSKGKDETLIQEHRERRIKTFGDNAHDDTLLYRASLLIEWIESPTGAMLTGQGPIQTVLENLPIKDVAHIRNLLTDPPFGVDTNLNIGCPLCNNDFNADLPLEANFFFPRTRNKKAMPA